MRKGEVGRRRCGMRPIVRSEYALPGFLGNSAGKYVFFAPFYELLYDGTNVD